MKYKHIALGLTCSLMFGCASVQSDFTALSSKNVNLSGLSIDRTKSKGVAFGEDCQSVFLIIPTSGPPTLDEALDRALESKNANLMLDATVEFSTIALPIFAQTCWTVKGEAYDSYE